MTIRLLPRAAPGDPSPADSPGAASNGFRNAPTHSILVRVAVVLGIAWALPNTVVGLALGLVGLARGARPRWRPHDLMLVFHRWPWGPGGALTLGNVVLHTGADLDVPCYTYAHAAGLAREPAIHLATHERAHVYQYLVLGPLFLPVYMLSGGVGVRNRFERAADRYSLTGCGWWPWPTPPLPSPADGRSRTA